MGSSKLHSRGAAAAILGSLFLVGLWFSGCNLFSPLAADNRGDLTYRGLILKGNDAINAADYVGAESYFSQAMAINPAGSEGYLFHAKALMNLHKMDYNNLNNEFDRHRNTPKHAAAKGVPFVDSGTSLKDIDSIYYPVATSVQDLEHILRKENDTIWFTDRWKLLPDGDTAGDGKISDGVARLDLGLLQAVKALLAPLDLDGNNRIDSACGAKLTPAAAAEKCKEGPLSEVNRFEDFKKLTKQVDLENLDSKDVNARNVSNNPNDINGFLDAMQGPIAASNYNLDSVTSTMDNHGEQKLSSQLDGIVGNITDLNSFLNYMRYNDRLDNDFDGQDTAGSLMIWYDFDKDNGVRFDYDDSARFVNLPSDAANIGHPMHRYFYGSQYYLTMAEYRVKFPVAAADVDSTGAPNKNSRIALMIKHCDEIVAKFATGNYGPRAQTLYPEVIKSNVCSTISPVIRPGIKPKPHSDWRGGTPGMDEEEIDEKDNDYDGLKDEDARNARLLDDDDDDILDIKMVLNPVNPPPMVWKDVAGHENKCPDIDTAIPMKGFPNQRENCIGSIENRIWWAKNFPDSLATHYSPFVGFEGGPSPNCLDDYLKLPAEYRAQFPSDATTRAGSVVRAACVYKHIWIAPKPPRSEWTAGTLGIDEEKLDGVDNDGDGWIDEDLE
jgi:hypothetical protein